MSNKLYGLKEVPEGSTCIDAWNAISPAEMREQLNRASERVKYERELLASMQEDSLSGKFSFKKILAEPNLLRRWLREQWCYLHYVPSKHPAFTQMKEEFEQIAKAIGNEHIEVNRLLDGKARRIARKHGYSINKGKAPYSHTNQGLFRVLNSDGVVCAGWNYDLSAQEVISLFRALDTYEGKGKLDEYKAKHLAELEANGDVH